MAIEMRTELPGATAEQAQAFVAQVPTQVQTFPGFIAGAHALTDYSGLRDGFRGIARGPRAMGAGVSPRRCYRRWGVRTFQRCTTGRPIRSSFDRRTEWIRAWSTSNAEHPRAYGEAG